MQQANQVFLSTFLIIFIGYLLKSYRFITEADAKIVSKFLMHTTFPALMFVSTVNTKLDSTLFAIPFMYFGFCSVMLLVAWQFFKNYPNKTRGLLLMSFGATNVGMFGFPLIEGLFGKEALKYAIMYDVGNTFFGFGVIYPIAKYFSIGEETKIDFRLIVKKIFSLPPFLGMIAGLTLNFMQVHPPDFVMNFMGTIAQGNKPIGLLLLGFFLSFNLDKKQLQSISKALVIRYLFNFLLAFIIYQLVQDLSTKNILMLCAVFPLGMTILPFSVEMNFDTKMAGTMVNLSLVISFILIWAMVLGFKMIG
jgi:malate permease and related proteins